MSRPTAVALLLIAGCSRQTVAVALPPNDAPATLLFIERGRTLDSLQIVERWAMTPGITRPPPALTDLDLDDIARLTTIPLSRPLAELGLSEGSFLPPSQGEALRTVTSSQQAAMERVIDRETTGDWRVAGSLDPSIAETLIPVPNPRCTLFRVRQIAGIDAPISFAIALDDRRLLVGLEYLDRLFRIDLDGTAVEVTPPADMFPAAGIMPSWGGFRESATIVWLSGTTGLWQVRLDADARPIEVLGVFPSPTPSPFRWLAGRIRPGDQELFALGQRGEFLRFDGTRLEKVGDIHFEIEREWRGGVAYAGRGEAFAAMNSDPEVIHYRNGQITHERVSLAPDRGNTGLDNIEGTGVILSDGFGNLLRPEDGQWRTIGETHAASGADSFAAFKSGFLYGSTDGLLGEWRGRDCPAEPPYVTLTVRIVLPLGGSVFVSGRPPSWLDPIED